MTESLLIGTLTKIDPHELRLLLENRIGGPGQYHDRTNNPDRIYLPLAGTECKVLLTFRTGRIVDLNPGPAFDRDEWERILDEVETTVLVGPSKVGREYSFSIFRVQGSWMGERSGVQILPAPDSAPRAPVEMADHPFLLEFRMQGIDIPAIAQYRRSRVHRDLTLLLNILLAARIRLQPPRGESVWANVARDDQVHEYRWVMRDFWAEGAHAIVDDFSPAAAKQIETVEPEEYYASPGYTVEPLRIPSDLDDSIWRYLKLYPENRVKFGRAAFWMDLARRHWETSASASFASLVSAVESLTNNGDRRNRSRRFCEFLEIYASGTTYSDRRRNMYELRSEILHGGNLLQLDQDHVFGWDPPWMEQRELHDELWNLARIALRNWLRNPPQEGGGTSPS
jgi:hypothetical protein